jgi:Fe2+ transport system protein B
MDFFSALETLCGLLPQIFLMFLFLFLIQKFLPQFQRFFPILLGFSCTTLAISSLPKGTKAKEKYFLTLIPCSAKWPLLLLILGFWAYPLVAVIIALGIFFLGFPKFDCPPLHFKDALNYSIGLIFRIFVCFVIASFILTVFDLHAITGSVIITALIFGLVAKEMAVSVFLLYPDFITELTPPTAIALCVFYLLYPVCISCQMALRNWKMFFISLFIAATASAGVYYIGQFIL